MIHRGYILTPNPMSPTMVTIALAGQGGRPPDLFQGSFTSYAEAKAIIDHYLDNLKVKTNGKADPKSGD